MEAVYCSCALETACSSCAMETAGSSCALEAACCSCALEAEAQSLAEYNLLPNVDGTAPDLRSRRNSWLKKSPSEKCSEHTTLDFAGVLTVPDAVETEFSHRLRRASRSEICYTSQSDVDITRLCFNTLPRLVHLLFSYVPVKCYTLLSFIWAVRVSTSRNVAILDHCRRSFTEFVVEYISAFTIQLCWILFRRWNLFRRLAPAPWQ